MAIRKNLPDQTKTIDKSFSTRTAAEEWVRNEKKNNKLLGMTVRFDIYLEKNQWRVKADYYL